MYAAVAANLLFLVQGLGDGLAEHDAHVFDEVVLVHFQIALGADAEIHLAVKGELLEKVIEEADARQSILSGTAVQVKDNPNPSFRGLPLNLRIADSRRAFHPFALYRRPTFEVPTREHNPPMVDPESLKAQHPELAPFDVRAINEDVTLAYAGSEVARISRRNAEWEISSDHGHMHFDSFDEALDVLLDLLQGQARWTLQYRGETLASTWIEFREEGSWESHRGATFICPFDEDEWESREGETWKVVRVQWQTTGTDQFRETFKEQVRDEAVSRPNSWLKLLDATLGPPRDRMKWTPGRDNRLVLQIPKGWRRTMDLSKEHQWVDFSPEKPGLLLRVRNYYRPSQAPVPERTTTIRPTLKEYEREDSSEHNNGWVCHRWTLTFMGDEDDMLAIVELFEHPSLTGAAEPIQQSLEDSLSAARYTPREWTMPVEQA